MKLHRSAKQIVTVLAAMAVYLLVFGIPFVSRDPELKSGPVVCQPGRYVIQVHGTMSTGAFHPGAALVRALDPRQPDVGIFSAATNGELGGFFDLARDCVLTFSFDDVYLAKDGTRRPGVHAWNAITSPWDRLPDELADHLQRLMDAEAYKQATFDIVAYSAGGIVPTYWAAREGTSDAQRARVRSIVVVDGVVSGADVGLFDLACVLPRSLRSARIGDLGRLPCQFRFGGEFTRAVRTAEWWKKVPLATVRADGDLIVWYEVAGLPGKTVLDPSILADSCEWWELFAFGVPSCVVRTHGSVLDDGGARDAIVQMIGP